MNDIAVPIFPEPAVTISGVNLVIDFHGATISGSPETSRPDDRRGLGVLVKGTNITIKNLHVRGYRVGLFASSVIGLKLVNCDLSYNWKQHLNSTLQKEDSRDWQSYHVNERDEWLRYGAGIYLRGCDKFDVSGCKVRGGQCGLMMTKCSHGRVWNNDFSFNSGLGVGMYRSSENQILYNHLDWNVRGFSYGAYNRGQDSAGILVYEQCNRNTFAYNSATHCGDGFFLWAGTTTMNTGEGGCNDNIIFANDFSHAPANGIEATFSRNVFIGNAVFECWHGLWGGYSHDSKIIDNRFGLNGEAISIEHGQDNVISLNRFAGDNAGIGIWQDPIDDHAWPYPKHHDTGSHSYVVRNNKFLQIARYAISMRNSTDALIDENAFMQSAVGVVLKNSSHIVTDGNSFETVSKPVQSDGEGSGNMLDFESDTTAGGTLGNNDPLPTMTPNGLPILDPPIALDNYLARFEDAHPPSFSGIVQTLRSQGSGDYDSYLVPPTKGVQLPYLPPNTLRGQRYILVDAWGPYDFQRPLLWPRKSNAADATRRSFEVLGPPGKWRVVALTGVKSLSSSSGVVPDELEVVLATTDMTKVEIELEYVGAATVDQKGVATPPGQPVRFRYGSRPQVTRH